MDQGSGTNPAHRYLSDTDRLSVLARTGLPDSDVDPSFDRLTRLAANLLGTPVALISLVDDSRQFFKSCFGLPDPWASQRETPLTHSFCQHVVSTREPLVIEDARRDPRVRGNLAITDINVVAYLGIPLSIDGHVIGSFCAIDGKPRAWASKDVEAMRDLTESVISEIRLRADHREILRQRDALEIEKRGFEAILESSLDCVKVIDADGRLTTMNANGCLLMEIDDLSPLIDQPWASMWPEASRELAATALESARNGLSASFQGMCPTAKGTFKWWDVTITPILATQGHAGRILAVSRDITASRTAQTLLSLQAESLLQADQRKDDFLAMLAHELRNPLAAIANASTLLTLSNKPEQLAYCKETIARQTRHLSRLIDDLLDVSRISQGKIDLRTDIIDIAATLESAVQTVRPLAEARQHTIEVSFERGNLWVDADQTRLEQVVVNLLNNAAKYSEDRGHIRLTAHRQGDTIVISIKDNGVGISPDKLPEMFELFTQADHSSARTEGGLGIGLTIVKHLVEMHGGSIAAHSDGPGTGSEFVVSLPAAGQPATSEPEAKRPGGATEFASILIVDDNIDTARSMARLLKFLGHQAILAHSGPEAIESARTHTPQVILLDIGLPGMDGYEVIRRLRAEPHGKTALILALSGYGKEADLQHAKAAGFDNHLVKPIDFDRLKTLLAERRHA